MTVPALPAVGLAKTYFTSDGEVAAVRGIDLAVPEGEFFGLLSPNGAGKSTTIGMVTTPDRPHLGVGVGSRHRRGPPSGRGETPHRDGVAEQHPGSGSDRRREPRVLWSVFRHELQPGA